MHSDLGGDVSGGNSVPQRQDETVIALRVGCTEGERCERGNHAGGKWPPRRKKREVCSAPVVVRHMEDRIVKESEVSASRCQDESPKYPYVDASVVSIYRCKYLHIDTSIHM